MQENVKALWEVLDVAGAEYMEGTGSSATKGTSLCLFLRNAETLISTN